MADVASIAPAGKMPDPLDAAKPMPDPLEGAKPLAGSSGDPLAVAGGSREPLKSKIKRFGRAAAQYDPSVPENMGRVAPIVAGAAPAIGLGIATEGASVPFQMGAAALGGAAGPFAAAGASKALGGNPAMPSWRDAAKDGLINAAFAGAGATFASLKGGAAEVAPEMERAAPTVKNLKQAVRNRDFWKSMGLSDEQADLAVKAPDAEEFATRSIEQADRTKEAYNRVINSTKQDFTVRYDDAYGKYKDTPVDVTPVASAMGKIADQGERELTPSFAKWLKSKSDELAGGGGQKIDVLGGKLKPSASTSPELQGGLEQKIRAQLAKEKAATATPNTPQTLRDLRTELRENMPAQPTPLDEKAAAQINQAIDQTHDDALLKAGANYEDLGRIHGVDKDYAVMKETERLFDPVNKEKLADGVNAALWGKMGANPDNAANLIRYAKAANDLNPDIMPKLKASFLDMAARTTRTGNAPMDEMKALQALQSKWGEKGGTQVVLNELFGKESPLADPKTMAKVLAAPVEKEKLGWASSMASRAASAPYLLRMGVLYGIAGGGMMAITRDPDKAALAVAGLAGLQIGSKLLSVLDTAGQRAYVNFRLNPTETNFKSFMKVSGAMIGATAEMPTSAPDSR